MDKNIKKIMEGKKVDLDLKKKIDLEKKMNRTDRELKKTIKSLERNEIGRKQILIDWANKYKEIWEVN